LEIRDHDPQSESTPKNWTRHAKLRKLRAGAMYEVRKDATHLSRRRLLAQLKHDRYQSASANMSALVNDVLESQRSTESPHHNGIVKLPDNALASVLRCWKCGTRTRVGRELLVMAVEHVKAHGGKILLTDGGINVKASAEEFDWKPHRRSRSRRRANQ
jgi:hypothetical protein